MICITQYGNCMKLHTYIANYQNSLLENVSQLVHYFLCWYWLLVTCQIFLIGLSNFDSLLDQSIYMWIHHDYSIYLYIRS